MRTMEADVVVAGAGTSGVPAAIAAARAGAKVILVEEDNLAGGAPVDCYIGMPCGGPRTGLYREMLNRLKEGHPLVGGTRWFLPSAYRAVIYEMIAQEPNLRLLCNAPVSSAIVEEGAGRPRVRGVRVSLPGGGEIRVKGAVTVDATGTGGVAVSAGCEAMYGRDAKSDFNEPHAPENADAVVQSLTWMYISQKTGRGPALDMRKMKCGGLDPVRGSWSESPEKCLAQDSGIYLHWGCAVECTDVRDPAALSQAQQAALAAMAEDHELLRQHGYEVHLAPKIGIRETTRVVGEHVVTENDLRSGQLPDDTIALGRYWLDIWGGMFPEPERTLPLFGIPYRALVPKDVDGLPMSAYRVQPILAGVGQAAGVAAAQCAVGDASPRDADANRIREALTSPAQGLCLDPESC